MAEDYYSNPDGKINSVPEDYYGGEVRTTDQAAAAVKADVQTFLPNRQEEEEEEDFDEGPESTIRKRWKIAGAFIGIFVFLVPIVIILTVCLGSPSSDTSFKTTEIG